MVNPHVVAFLKRLEKKYSFDSEDMTMSSWIEQNTKLKGKPFSFADYQFQRQIVDDLHPNLDCSKCSQVGLALSLDTPVPTPRGWTTMGELQVGDLVFDEKGQPCTVEYVSPVYSDHKCYAVSFDDKQTLIADAGHRWFVQSDRSFDLSGVYSGRGRPPSSVKMFKDGVLTTQQIFQFYKEGYRNRFAIPNTQPLASSEIDLPVDPYLLGLLLGDGNSHACVLTADRDDAKFYEAELERRGLVCVPSSEKGDVVQFLVHFPDQICRPGRGKPNSISSRLASLGLLKGHKFVPEQYLRASPSQRLDLLRGLLDTDGSITKRGRVSFHNTCKELVEAAEDLACSLGFKARIRWRMGAPSTMKNGHVITPRKPVAEVSFVAYAEDGVFLLPRKQERLLKRVDGRSTEAFRRRIVSVLPAPSIPVRCISVNSPSHLFLAGRGMIPTHNTEVQLRKMLGFLRRYNGTSGIFTLPNEKMFKRLSKTRVKPFLQDNPIFSPEEETNNRSMDLMQFGQSFLYITGATEGDATSTPADIVFNDEVDLTDQHMLVLFNSRMQNSHWKISQRFSTPTFLDYGIDLGFGSSDQHEYMCKCRTCGHHNIPDFNKEFLDIPGLPEEVLDELSLIDMKIVEKLDLSNARVVCERCHAPLDLDDYEMRQWVPRYPDRSKMARGYRIRPFVTSRIDVPYIIRQLLEYKKRDYVRGWYNTVLGRPYTDANARLTEKAIRDCLVSPAVIPINSDEPAWIGADVGQSCHVVIGKGPSENVVVTNFLTMPANELIPFVTEFKKTHRLIAGAMDRYPYTPTAEAVFEASDHRVFNVEYRGHKEANPIKDLDGSVLYFQADRTKLLDEVARRIRNRNLDMGGYGHHDHVVIQHLRDMVRDEQPEMPAVWRKLTGNDHYFHALGFLLFAVKIQQVLDLLNDEDRRVMISVLGVDTKPTNSGLIGYGSASRLGFSERRFSRRS